MENNQKEIILLRKMAMKCPTATSKQKKKYGLFRCFCGNEFKTQIASVKSGLIISCGCYQKQKAKEIQTTHNLTSHRLYNTWFNMIDRCTNKNNKYYSYYGGRGITVCNEWLDVANFIDDMYPSFQEGLSIDRIDTNGNYCKDNCRWTNKSVQSRNTRLLRVDNKSGYRGVSWYKLSNKWKAQIRVNNEKIYLGYFTTAIDAAKAYDNYIINNNLEHTKNF